MRMTSTTRTFQLLFVPGAKISSSVEKGRVHGLLISKLLAVRNRKAQLELG